MQPLVGHYSILARSPLDSDESRHHPGPWLRFRMRNLPDAKGKFRRAASRGALPRGRIQALKLEGVTMMCRDVSFVPEPDSPVSTLVLFGRTSECLATLAGVLAEWMTGEG